MLPSAPQLEPRPVPSPRRSMAAAAHIVDHTASTTGHRRLRSSVDTHRSRLLRLRSKPAGSDRLTDRSFAGIPGTALLLLVVGLAACLRR